MTRERTGSVATIAAVMAAIAIVGWMLLTPERRTSPDGHGSTIPHGADPEAPIRGAPLVDARDGDQASGDGPDHDSASAADPSVDADSREGVAAREDSAASTPPGAPTRVLSPHSFERLRALEATAHDPSAPPPSESDRPALIPFSFLSSFPYRTPQAHELGDRDFVVENLADQIPPEVRAWDEHSIRLLGFMIPLEFDGRGRMTAFILTQDQNYCCFGQVPAMNAWATVRLEPGEFAQYRATVPVGVEGTLEVGEVIEEGWVTSVYRLRARRILSMDELLDEVEREARTHGSPSDAR